MKENPKGLRFTDLKQLTGLHQDTLTVRLNESVEDGTVHLDDKLYAISSEGDDDLSRRRLISQIVSAEGMVAVGEAESASMYPDEDVVLNTIVGYGFPAISPGVVGALRRILQKYWMLHLITTLASNHKVDPRCLTGEKPVEDMVEELKSAMTSKALVLAFLIDQRELRNKLNSEYLKEIIRLAKVEDRYHLENKNSDFTEAWHRYARKG